MWCPSTSATASADFYRQQQQQRLNVALLATLVALACGASARFRFMLNDFDGIKGAINAAINRVAGNDEMEQAKWSVYVVVVVVALILSRRFRLHIIHLHRYTTPAKAQAHRFELSKFSVRIDL